jgi:hypothetical protein
MCVCTSVRSRTAERRDVRNGAGGYDGDEDEEGARAGGVEEEAQAYDYSDGADDDPTTAALRDALTRDVERAFPRGSAGAMRRLSEEVSELG